MLKNILIKTAELINRDDIINELTTNTPSGSQLIQNDILRLISYYNYILENLCEHYFKTTHKQNICSDKNKKISFLNFSFQPINIINVSKGNKKVFFSEYSKYITVPESNVTYEITYQYLPDAITNLNDKLNLPEGITIKMLCYGIASEFTASKNQIEQAEYWNNKFMLEIFKTKANKNRKLKPNFYL